MFKTLRNAFKIKDIRKKLLFTFLMLIVIRIGSLLPIPGVDTESFSSAIRNFFDKTSGSSTFLSAITGGSFENMSIFALGITPYITSSIIMQLLTIAIPKLEEMQKDGAEGRKKIAEITRYVTVALAVLEAIGMAITFNNQGLLKSGSEWVEIMIIVVTLTAGSAFLMWIGENITEKGIGNGISIILLINIISSVPTDMGLLYATFIASETNIAKAILAGVIILAIIFAMVWFVCLLQGGERKIPVQYSQKVQGNKMVGGNASNIPLKVNTAGVIPVIFASSILQAPVVIANFVSSKGYEWTKYFSQQYWCNPKDFKYTIGMLAYIVLIIVFAYFYTSISFNPMEIANNMKKQAGFIPGIRPGKPTTEYLNNILNYVVFIGAVALVVVAVVPIVLSGVFGASVSFLGTSIIIVVSVILETIKKVESQMLVRNYKGFLNS
ncbi:MAG: preprotein translocase subunit SecY [Lachnospira sp.]|nr:preprotein translocase subunit SecY [Lachnospira sp.]